MRNFKKYFKKLKLTRGLILALIILFIFHPSYGGSIREIGQNIERVKSLEPPFQFAVIGDSRDGEKVYTHLIQKILERKPNFIIHLGDMIAKPHEKEWRAFFDISKAIDLPFFPVVGNHDVGDTLRGQKIYRKQFFLPDGETYYAFRAGGGLFIILDSERENGRIIKEQWTWLADMLSSKETFKLIFIHRPLYLPMDSLKKGKGMDKYPFDRDDLHQLFVKRGVKAVFAADDHRYDRREKKGILYIITGGGGAPIYARKDRGGYFHYVWISVRDGKIEGEVIDLEEQIQDRFVIEYEERRQKMGFALALIVMGVLILLDRMGTGYGLREGWPWMVVALGIGGLFRNRKSLAAWTTTILGIFILGAKYYPIHISIPAVIKTYLLPVLLILIGLLWIWRYKRD